MSFFQTLASFFGGGKKDPEEPTENPIELPAAATEAFDREFAKVMPIAIEKTLALTTGIPDDLKEAIGRKILTEYSMFSRSHDTIEDEILAMLDGHEWSWVEWDFWRAICIKRRQYTNGMRCWCFPWADELDLEYERTEYEPARVFNLMTLKEAKERLTAFPEVAAMKKAEVVDFLTKNEDAWHSVIDPHIQAKWDRKKHYEGPTPKLVLGLMLRTIGDRTRYLRDAKRIERIKCKAEEKFTFTYDQELSAYAKRIKGNPWKENFGPSVPGLDVWISMK